MKTIRKIRLATVLAALAMAVITAVFYQYYRIGSNRTTVVLMEDTELETELVIIRGSSPGRTLFVVGGVHGDETSGWKAAGQLKKIRRLKSGVLIILSPANAPGSRNGVRNVEAYRDLNRSFPGDRDRDCTDQLAASIFQAISVHAPALVLDLHEARREEGNRDFLGNSLIFSDTAGMEDLIFELLADTEKGALCSSPFSYYGPAPSGSLNREVTEQLGIPVITIEASREDPEEIRIQNHLDLIREIMRRYSTD